MNQYKGEVKGELGGEERTFRLTFESIVKIENKLNKSIVSMAQDMAQAKYTFQDILIILHEGLLGTGKNVLQESVGDWIMKSGIVKASETAGIILASAFTGENKENDDPLVKAESTQKTTQSNNT
mgnify:FL=1